MKRRGSGTEPQVRKTRNVCSVLTTYGFITYNFISASFCNSPFFPVSLRTSRINTTLVLQLWENALSNENWDFHSCTVLMSESQGSIFGDLVTQTHILPQGTPLHPPHILTQLQRALGPPKASSQSSAAVSLPLTSPASDLRRCTPENRSLCVLLFNGCFLVAVDSVDTMMQK